MKMKINDTSFNHNWNNQDDIENGLNWHRDRIVESDILLEDSTKSLKNVSQLSYQNEYIGTSTLNELNRNRQTLEMTNDNLYTIDDNMGKTRRIILNKSRRVATNKCILVFIMMILICAIGFTIWFRWIRTPRSG